MKEGFLIEGHRAKTGIEFEDTLIMDDSTLYPSEKAASGKAHEFLGKDQTLELVVIYAVDELGEKRGIKFLFRDKEGGVSEVDSWWSFGPIIEECGPNC